MTCQRCGEWSISVIGGFYCDACAGRKSTLLERQLLASLEEQKGRTSMKSKMYEGLAALAVAMGAKHSGRVDYVDLESGVTTEFLAELVTGDANAKRETQLSIERGTASVYEVVTAMVGCLLVTARISRPATPTDVEDFAERMRREHAKAVQSRPETPVVVVPRGNFVEDAS